MASNTFGKLLTVTTWGESHGPQMGLVIDGFPPGIPIDATRINKALELRRPGKNAFTSPRNEPDIAIIQSGVFEGLSTGAPIAITIQNQDADSSKYESVKHILRPGHAQYTYLQKYGIYDYKGGGRASARETACRVAAAAVAETLLEQEGIEVISWLDTIGTLALSPNMDDFNATQSSVNQSPLFLYSVVSKSHKGTEGIEAKTLSTEDAEIDSDNEIKAKAYLEGIIDSKDSIGGIVGFYIRSLKAGLGDPIYDKLEAKLAAAMLSIPASKGFEIGEGFKTVKMKGSECNDAFCLDGNQIKTQSNHAGGILGGITNGMPVYGRVAFKPTSSHQHLTPSVNLEGTEEVFQIPEGSRHDPCVAIRAVPVVRAMAILCIADLLLANKIIKSYRK